MGTDATRGMYELGGPASLAMESPGGSAGPAGAEAWWVTPHPHRATAQRTTPVDRNQGIYLKRTGGRSTPRVLRKPAATAAR